MPRPRNQPPKSLSPGWDRLCSGCNQHRRADEYLWSAKGKLHRYCRSCMYERNAAWYAGRTGPEPDSIRAVRAEISRHFAEVAELRAQIAALKAAQVIEL